MRVTLRKGRTEEEKGVRAYTDGEVRAKNKARES